MVRITSVTFSESMSSECAYLVIRHQTHANLQRQKEISETLNASVMMDQKSTYTAYLDAITLLL